jgi:hypothetical protein
MNWKQLIADLRKRGLTLEAIRAECGFASRGHVHDLGGGKSFTVSWEIGNKLIRFHKRVMRRKAK